MDGPAALFFLVEVSLLRVPTVLLSIHIVSYTYFRTYTRLVQYLFFKQPLNTIFPGNEDILQASALPGCYNGTRAGRDCR